MLKHYLQKKSNAPQCPFSKVLLTPCKRCTKHDSETT